MHIFTIGGRLAFTPELNFDKNGKSYARFAVWSKEFGEDNDLKVSGFLRGKTAEFACKNTGKGDYVVISGEITLHEYDGKTELQFNYVNKYEPGWGTKKKEEGEEEPERDL